MATALDAVVVRENATFLAVPNDDPKYMGRTFNKMLNYGARAIYEAIASAKLAWLGIPELRIPSPYTSKADLSAWPSAKHFTSWLCEVAPGFGTIG